ncbi:helix-turn-helix domain-containing protein [Lentibacillus sediminis]|uniref:helix-turn-helix domain-containing protein n=1 Tax=Lentibacillus sediminis TaxID=1940529 RepID=UPI000C1C140D|nr:helix-turn-helix domain-containing protein [Lentibacillus sediminis]
MEMGSFIKLHRQKKELTQGELAKGIVSLSYLSKIENKKTDASPEIMQMLCTRLGVQMNNELDADTQEKCKRWYGMLFAVNDKEEIVSLYNELQEVMNRSLSGGLVMFEIHKIRYYLVLGEFKEALNVINELNEMAPSFNHVEQFYWFKYRGNYNSASGDFNQAMQLYEQAEEKLNQIDIEDKEIGDLQYIIAVTHSKLRNTLEVIDYANKAMDVFQREYNFNRCAQCHIVLGIAYRRIKMYDKAIKNYNLAKHLGQLNKDKQVIQLTNLNLGYLHSAINETNEAISYFLEVAEDEQVAHSERLGAITALIKEYYGIDNYEKTENMINKAHEILDVAKKDIYTELFDYVIQTYTYAINEDHEKFRKLVTDDFIPYLMDNKDYANLVTYSNMLAEHYESLGKYKESVKYYKLANSTFDELINL